MNGNRPTKNVTPARAAGGHARAANMTPEERSEVARLAAAGRWAANVPRSTHSGVLHLGAHELDCYVLEDSTRILSTRGIMKSLGRGWRGRKYPGTELPVFVEAKNLKPFIDNNLSLVLSPVHFRTEKGSRAEGFRAEALPAVCDIYLRAREAEVLTAQQGVIARNCEILVRALAKVGIVALVDEATGFQEVRDRLALQKILERYLREEYAAWAKRFPDEFYWQIFRLRGWPWKGMKVNRPQVVATYTKDLVYSRLAPGILAELERRNPVSERGSRRTKHHQYLTDDVGHPALGRHLHAVIGLMRASETWSQMLKLVNRAFPRIDESQQMDLFLDVEPAV